MNANPWPLLHLFIFAAFMFGASFCTLVGGIPS